MITSEIAKDRAARLVELALRAGADAAEAVVSGSASETVGVRLGQLEDIERSEDEHAGVRVFIGRRSASTGGSDFSTAGLAEMAERAVAMARHATEDPYAMLVPREQLARGPFPDLDLVDPTESAPEALRERALETEDAARAVSGVTNSNGASAGCGNSVSALATSEGFAEAYGATSHFLSASMIAGEGGRMQRDYESKSARHRGDLPDCAAVGRTAGERAVARLDPVSMASGTFQVVFDPRVGGSLVGHLIGAMSGMSAARRSTFLLDRLDDAIFPAAIRLVEEPHRPRALRSRPFDGEGLATGPRVLVEGGRVTGWLANLASASQLGIAPTGHAVRGGMGAPGIATANVDLQPGALSPAQLIGEIADGVYVTELIGQGVKGVTGDYSRAAAGFRIRDGELAEAVAEFTIAGNLVAMFGALSAANDLERDRAINVPTLRVDGMTIAGG
ncbi:TldD/PmbA family protein [Parerythrobacter lacustris]|uniref:TldD/PmbA family protein n=1 Tax=Parerythrobacter lacustris TaxID=2969984 RepID=A0ABT1XUU8_9SPHN|nr:TldD/PmbA family protein [Parerythrobacter lacustris]MCR2834212.1 TldD/PmbA family protein [Parerythrobacter lacustris]